MRLRHIALGCALTGGLGFLALPTGPALAGNTGLAGNGLPEHRLAGNTALAARDAKPEISVSSPETDNPYGAKITLTVTLKPAVAGRAVALYATPSGGPRALVATGTVDAEGKWYAPYSITRATDVHRRLRRRRAPRPRLGQPPVLRVRAGDGPARRRLRDQPGQRRHRRRRLPRRRHAHPVLDGRAGQARRVPGAGVRAVRQGRRLGRRHQVRLRQAGPRQPRPAPFSLSLAAGDRYRIRGDYLRGKDTANLSTTGPWLYFIVAK